MFIGFLMSSIHARLTTAATAFLTLVNSEAKNSFSDKRLALEIKRKSATGKKSVILR
jgi:hypothetical protein